MEKLTSDFAENVRYLDSVLGVGRNCDVISRRLVIGGRNARLWSVDGYSSDDVTERINSALLRVRPEEIQGITEMQELADRFVTFLETNVTVICEDIVTAVLLGKTLLLAEGATGAALMDAKSYPNRSVEAPQDAKVLRGARDGFVETLVQNTALLRRRVRDPHLIMEGHKIGSRSRTDVVICYLEGRVDESALQEVRRKLESVDVHSLSMGQESVAEAMMKRQWYNPFPRVRYTERPDVATASVMEGSVILLVDNSPAVMLLPTTFFDFWQGVNEFYFPPVVGTYFRIIRLLVQLTLIATPLWYLAAVGSPWLAPLGLPQMSSEGSIPLYWQIISMEIVLDVLKLASLNTPESISTSFSMLGALVLGEFAVEVDWVLPQVLVYLALASIANSVQASYEMGYAMKLSRMFLVTMSMLLDVWGLLIGLVLLAVLLLTTKPLVGKYYLRPLIPFDGKAFLRLFYRRPISKKNT
jgi:stage V sporulation protein AF